jgi:nucleoside-diphosphate-sugar epimerase
MAANLELATTIPKGSWVLVTGATGYIAGHVVNQFLSRGYRVRGTARSLSNAQWLVKELYQKEVAAGDFKLVEIPDMAADGAYDEAIRGVSAVAHIATDTSLSPDPNKVIPQTLAGVTNLLRAAAAEPSVEQFVYTSSMAAVRIPVPGVVFHVDENTWNDAALAQAWAPPPYDSSRSIIVYAASKVEAERAVWKFVKEEKPAFAVNVVLPFTAFGPVLHEKQNTSTAALLLGLFNGKVTPQHLGMPAGKSKFPHTLPSALDCPVSIS